MKAKVEQSHYWVSIELTPEQITEISVLYELTRNTKREVPVVYLSFPQGNTPSLLIQFSKRALTKQIRSITNSKN